MRAISSTSFFMRVDFRTFAEQGQLELEAGKDGAQIVGDAGEHGGALLDRAFDARLHFEKAAAARRTSRAPRGRKFGASRPLPKALGRVR